MFYDLEQGNTNYNPGNINSKCHSKTRPVDENRTKQYPIKALEGFVETILYSKWNNNKPKESVTL